MEGKGWEQGHRPMRAQARVCPAPTGSASTLWAAAAASQATFPPPQPPNPPTHPPPPPPQVKAILEELGALEHKDGGEGQAEGGSEGSITIQPLGLLARSLQVRGRPRGTHVHF